MNYSATDVMREVRAELDRHLDDGREVAKEIMVSAIVNAHPEIEGDDADFYRVCAYGHIDACFRKSLRDRKQQEADATPDQFTLPGFLYVQRAYLIEREGKSVMVETDQLTSEEGLRKAAELRAFAAGALAHADELERYIALRDAPSLPLGETGSHASL